MIDGLNLLSTATNVQPGIYTTLNFKWYRNVTEDRFRFSSNPKLLKNETGVFFSDVFLLNSYTMLVTTYDSEKSTTVTVTFSHMGIPSYLEQKFRGPPLPKLRLR
jgi:hypothetical protein